MGAIQELTVATGGSERSLRRAANKGTFRIQRLGPRRFKIQKSELDYLRGHWELLAKLQGLLRTERQIRLAVLYGSFARGDEDQDSDIDLLISTTDNDPWAEQELAIKLEQALDRPVDVADLDHVSDRSVSLLLEIIDDGRVIIDRDQQWTKLQRQRPAIYARTQYFAQKQAKYLAKALQELEE